MTDSITRTPGIFIALCSTAMGSGKSTVADHLVDRHGFLALKFAGPLKAMTTAFFSAQGEVSETVARRVDGDLKEAPLGYLPDLGNHVLRAMVSRLIDCLGVDTHVHSDDVIPALRATPVRVLHALEVTWAPLVRAYGSDITSRRIQQLIGTEFGRDCLHENVWADIVKARALGFLARGINVVVDDMRYRNELETVRWAGGHPLRVVRPGVKVTSDHSSEGELDSTPMLALLNNGSVEDLHRKTDQRIAWLRDSLNS